MQLVSFVPVTGNGQCDDLNGLTNVFYTLYSSLLFLTKLQVLKVIFIDYIETHWNTFYRIF